MILKQWLGYCYRLSRDSRKVFFYILALQKLKQFSVLKAIGMSMGQITESGIIVEFFPLSGLESD